MISLEVAAINCPAGSRGTGGVCNCMKLEGWAEGKWRKPWCYEGKCYTGHDYEKCKGIKYHDLRDGTWCWKGERNALCPTALGKFLKLY